MAEMQLVNDNWHFQAADSKLWNSFLQKVQLPECWNIFLQVISTQVMCFRSKAVTKHHVAFMYLLGLPWLFFSFSKTVLLQCFGKDHRKTGMVVMCLEMFGFFHLTWQPFSLILSPLQPFSAATMPFF